MHMILFVWCKYKKVNNIIVCLYCRLNYNLQSLCKGISMDTFPGSKNAYKNFRVALFIVCKPNPVGI